jgi:hypothetical protein
MSLFVCLCVFFCFNHFFCSFPYFPLAPLLDPQSMWTPVIMNFVTRFLALACACAVSAIFFFAFVLFKRLADGCTARRRERRFFEGVK